MRSCERWEHGARSGLNRVVPRTCSGLRGSGEVRVRGVVKALGPVMPGRLVCAALFARRWLPGRPASHSCRPAVG